MSMGKAEMAQAKAIARQTFRKVSGITQDLPRRAQLERTLELGVVNQKCGISSHLLGNSDPHHCSCPWSPHCGSRGSALEPGSASLLTGSEQKGKGPSVVAVTNAIDLISRWRRR